MATELTIEPEATTFAPEEPGGDRWALNFGPQHPATHTTLRLVLELDGERILSCTPHIGYLHSGFEKLGEHLDYNQYVVVTDRMNYISPMANNIAWHHACEKLFGIELTPRCNVGTTSARGVAVSGGLAYVADAESGLRVIDVSSCDRGACCINDGCLEISRAECEAVSGTYLGTGTTCATEGCPLPCVSDLNDNGEVDFQDLLALLFAWGPCPE